MVTGKDEEGHRLGDRDDETDLSVSEEGRGGLEDIAQENEWAETSVEKAQLQFFTVVAAEKMSKATGWVS